MPVSNPAKGTVNMREATSLPLSRALFRLSLCVLLVASYLPVFTLYARQHWSTMNLQGAYAHAPLSLLLIAFLIWRQHSSFSLSETLDNSPGPLAFVLLGLGVILKIYGDVQGYVVLQGISIVPVLLGLLRIYFNASTFRAMRFPVLFLVFVIPLPSAAIDAVTLPLINITADLVAGILPLLNVEVARSANVLTVNGAGLDAIHQIIVAPECSGIRSLVSLLALSSLFTHMLGRSAGHSAALMLLTIPLVVLGNLIRVTSTVLMIVFVSPDTAESFFHWSSGLLLFAVTLAGLFAADAILTQIKTGKESGYEHGG